MIYDSIIEAQIRLMRKQLTELEIALMHNEGGDYDAVETALLRATTALSYAKTQIIETV